MSLTAFTWIAVYLGLTLLTFLRPAYGMALYLLTFFAFPKLWWWGGPIADVLGDRISLFTALVFAAAVFGHALQSPPRLGREQLWVLALLLLYALNATAVHYANASNPTRSFSGMTMIWKQVGLLLLLMLSMRNRFDFNILIAAILFGTFYMEYEAIVNGRGHFSSGRLEGIGAAGIGDANYLAGLLLLVPPLAAYWLFFGSYTQRAFAAVCQIFSFEVILRCNSRGAFLAMALAGCWLLFAARGKARRYAFAGLCLGGLAALFMVNDQQIIDRFYTTFASAEERDGSAQGRLNYWRGAVSMVAEHPVGSGAEAAFKSKRGAPYIRQFVNLERHPDGFRAVHNGYLDIAASWGVQGFLLYVAAISVSWWSIRKTMRMARGTADHKTAFLGACLQSVLVGQLAATMFLSSLDGEWFFWLFALATAFSQLYAPQQLYPPGFAPPLAYAGQSGSLYYRQVHAEPMRPEAPSRSTP